MKECCDSKSCDVAYYVSSKCYLVKCSDKAACSLVKLKSSKDSPLIAKMIKAEKEQKTGKNLFLYTEKCKRIIMLVIIMIIENNSEGNWPLGRGNKKKRKHSNVT